MFNDISAIRTNIERIIELFEGATSRGEPEAIEGSAP
jgi:hypothetical protein